MFYTHVFVHLFTLFFLHHELAWLIMPSIIMSPIIMSPDKKE